MAELPWAFAGEIAKEVSSGRTTAVAVIRATLSHIAATDPGINAFTAITAARAMAEAGAVDAKVKAGEAPGPLAGVPFAVKNLFDIEGLPTLAGSKINRDRTPAIRDAVLIRRLRCAGAVLVGALGMGEYAYDFTGENFHDGPCRNPHDPLRTSGGSSSGSGAATAAGMAPISLGSDTNGSLRVPAALCGVFSLKPTYGRLPRTGTFSFVDSLDHLGPFARSAGDLALAYDAMQGPDPEDHGCAPRAAELSVDRLEEELPRLRIGLASGWLAQNCGPEAMVAAEAAAAGIDGAETGRPDLDAAEMGRAAAYLITNAEAAEFHLDRLRTRAADFDPYARDRLLAGALLPASWVGRAQRVRAWWLKTALDVLTRYDALVLPATPFPATPLGTNEIELAGRVVPLRPSLGLLAQPFSCIGLPVVTVPVFSPGELPCGVQIITAPWREALGLRIARALERSGVAVAHRPELAAEPRRTVALGQQGMG